jgi:hypothetical protein
MNIHPRYIKNFIQYRRYIMPNQIKKPEIEQPWGVWSWIEDNIISPICAAIFICLILYTIPMILLKGF